MLEKIKNFFHKVGEKIKAVGKWIKDHVRDILKAVAGIGVSALVIGVYTTVGHRDTKLIYAVEYIGALALAGVLTHAVEQHIDNECDDILDAKQQIEDSIDAIALAKAMEQVQEAQNG